MAAYCLLVVSASASCTPSTAPPLPYQNGLWTFPCESAENAQTKLHWRVWDDNGVTKVDLALQSMAGTGWAALGFGTGMHGSTVYSAQENGVGGWYQIGFAYSSSAITPVTPTTVLFDNVHVQRNAQGLFVSVLGIRSLNPAAANLIWSYQTSGTFPLNPHSFNTRSKGVYNLQTGQVARSDDNKIKLMRWHGWLQVTAWCYLCPLAVIAKAFSSFCGWNDPSVGGFSIGFLIHVSLMGLAVIFSVSGLIISVSQFDGSPGNGHTTIGWIVVLLCGVQIILGVVASIFRKTSDTVAGASEPAADESVEPAEAPGKLRFWFGLSHRIVAWTIVSLAMVNIFVGADYFDRTYDADQKFTVTAAVGLAVLYGAQIIGNLVKLSMAVCGDTEKTSDDHIGAELPKGPDGEALQREPTTEAKDASWVWAFFFIWPFSVPSGEPC